ncbi:Protein kinase, catalytic domain protein [Nannochloropsis gaditana]|uniref:Protein kinase, catalytic domain protein n=1 Tax=Nannochloropsis gaditana TaxID=72520 RepID=W7TD00_9STRA|nr:Protein kinase, catalytic domain protein [Nannochloropsis gaditana]
MIQGGRGREGEEAQQELVEKSLPAAASRKSFSCSQISTSSSSPSSIPSSSPSSSPLRLVYCPASCFFTHPATFTVLACAENSDEWSLPLRLTRPRSGLSEEDRQERLRQVWIPERHTLPYPSTLTSSSSSLSSCSAAINAPHGPTPSSSLRLPSLRASTPSCSLPTPLPPSPDGQGTRGERITPSFLSARGLLFSLPIPRSTRREEIERRDGREGGRVGGMEGGNEDKVFHPLAETGEGKLYTFSVGHSHYVLKRYHKHAAGKALKELAVLLHLSASIRACPSSAPSVHPPFLASLCGVVWNHNNTEAGGEGESGSKEEKASRPSALVLERVLLNGQKTENRVDLRAFLVHRREAQEASLPPFLPLPLPHLLTLAEALGEALAFVHGKGLCHRDVHSGNILLSHFEEDTLPISGSVVNPLTLSCPQRPLLRIKLADFGLACSFNPLRAWLDLRALAYVLTEAAHDGVDRTGGFGDTEGASERLKQWEDFDPSERKKQWPLPARLTAKWSLSLPSPAEQVSFFSMHDLSPYFRRSLAPLLLGVFGGGEDRRQPAEGGEKGEKGRKCTQWTPLGVAAWARRERQDWSGHIRNSI